MKYEPPKYERLSEMAYIDVARLTEQEARAILENLRWGKKIRCIYCDSIKVSRVEPKAKSTGTESCFATNAASNSQ